MTEKKTLNWKRRRKHKQKLSKRWLHYSILTHSFWSNLKLKDLHRNKSSKFSLLPHLAPLSLDPSLFQDKVQCLRFLKVFNSPIHLSRCQ